MTTFAPTAASILRDNAWRLPDLSPVTVVVPHHHLIQPLLAALRKQIATPTFLPPRLLTLPALATTVTTGVSTLPDSLRLAELHGLLRRFDWIDETARWPIAGALHDALRELDESLLRPPADLDDFRGQVEAVLRRRLPEPLAVETRLVFEVWRAFHLGPPGSAAAYSLGLAAWLDQARAPLYVLEPHGLSRLEERFLTACRERIGLVELPLAHDRPSRRDLLREALADDTPLALRARATAFAAAHPSSPLAESVELCAADDLEAEAQTVATRIRAWLAEGRRNIAIIALDRLAARRLRAILERDRVLVQDETGWTFSTAAVSHVLDRWLALLRDGFYYRDLLDLLKSPFVFADVDADDRLAAVAALEDRVRQQSVVAGLDNFLAVGRAGMTARTVLPLLQRLESAAGLFKHPRLRPLAGWLATLRTALDGLGATPAFAADNAGRQLLDLLGRLGRELEADANRHSLADWHAWLDLQLDSATFIECDIESPIRLTHLNAARLRDFQAVVVLGADANHLPGRERRGLFSDDLRVRLGLRSQQARHKELRDILIDVLGRADRALLTWQANLGLDPNPASPWLTLVDAFHHMAYGAGLRRITAARASIRHGTTAEPEGPPAPALDRMPNRLNATAWQRLVSCPYRYFAADGLGLGEAEDVSETMEKADYGQIVHAVLKAFHDTHQHLAAHCREDLIAALTDASGDAFAAREQQHFLAAAWRLRWERHIPAYIDWALAWERNGHVLRATEQRIEHSLRIADGLALSLHGRLDRLDSGEPGLTVLDYKTQSREALRAKVGIPAEDVQLAFYGLLSGAGEAAFVGLDDARVEAIGPAHPLSDLVAAEAARLQVTWAEIAGGAGLPAQGAPATCQWCAMRGLCRRDFWPGSGS